MTPATLLRAAALLERDVRGSLTWQQEALYRLMSDISEDSYCAGWMSGNEFSLWAMVADPSVSRDYGMAPVAESDVAKMKEIADHVGGWIYWHDDSYDPDAPVEEWGPRFIEMPEWLERYAQRVEMWRVAAELRKGASL